MVNTMEKFATHFNKEEVKWLCGKIAMPAEAAQEVLRIMDTEDFSELEPFLDDLCIASKAGEAYFKIEALLKEKEQKGFLWLTISLAAALCSLETYESQGISKTIYFDTMACFSRFAAEHKGSFGKYGFDRAFWSYRQLSNQLFRLGALEFEMYAYPGEDLIHEGRVILKKGESCLSVHIPSDARINEQSCHESYHQAVKFFQTYYKEFKYDLLYLETWMLSPNLEKVLPKTSNILSFQKDYLLCRELPEDDSYRQWVFKDDKLPIEECPENTSLQRNIKSYLRTGGIIGSGEGVIPKEKFC